jgi:hypothetical protein
MARSECGCAHQPLVGLPCTESLAGVAQSAEQPSCKRQVSGSNPLTGSQVPSGPGSSVYGPGRPECSQGAQPARHSKITFAVDRLALDLREQMRVGVHRQAIWLRPRVFITVRGEAPPPGGRTRTNGADHESGERSMPGGHREDHRATGALIMIKLAPGRKQDRDLRSHSDQSSANSAKLKQLPGHMLERSWVDLNGSAERILKQEGQHQGCAYHCGHGCHHEVA